MSTLLVAAIVAVIGPVLLAILNGYSRRKEKREDWARQDLVALRAAEAAEAMAVSAAQAAELLVATTERVEQTAKATNEKLDVIHVLVNSNMTAAMQAELDATKREVVMMREVVRLNEAAGREPTQEALEAIESTKDKITELTDALDDRRRQAEVVSHLPKGT